MPNYLFFGRDSQKKEITGERSGITAESVGNQLLREGITPITIKLKENKPGNQGLKFWRKRLSADDMAIFARQMYTLTRSGVAITSALRQLGSSSRSPTLSNAIQGIVEKLESGQDLATSMSEYPDIFSPLMISMMRVGQNSGRLEEAFLRLNQYLETEGVTRKRIKSALRYPTFILISLIAAIILINVFVIPTFTTVFEQANVPLPYVTQMLVGFSNFIVHYWFLLLAIIAGIGVWGYYYLKSKKGQYNWGKLQLKLPVFGKIIKRTLLLRFTQSFSIVVSSGVPVVEGLGLVAETIQNVYAQSEVNKVRDAVEHGRNLTQSFAESSLFTPLEIQMLAVSEETGELALMLDQLASYYNREVEYDLKKLSDSIEPIMIIGLSIVVLILAFSVYLPVWNMVNFAH